MEARRLELEAGRLEAEASVPIVGRSLPGDRQAERDAADARQRATFARSRAERLAAAAGVDPYARLATRAEEHAERARRAVKLAAAGILDRGAVDRAVEASLSADVGDEGR